MPTDSARLHAVFDLAMRIGEGLLTNGAAASEVTATVLRVTSSSGLRDVSVEDIFIGNGVSELITMTMQALLDDGDEVLIPSPDYPLYTAVVALSGGYSRDDANARLAKNPGVVASFSRALTEGLSAQQSDAEFNASLDKAIDSIYRASIA